MLPKVGSRCFARAFKLLIAHRERERAMMRRSTGYRGQLNWASKSSQKDRSWESITCLSGPNLETCVSASLVDVHKCSADASCACELCQDLLDELGWATRHNQATSGGKFEIHTLAPHQSFEQIALSYRSSRS